ncbi:MAG: DUF547 domain-containing protein [Pseudomonadota bacterium]
MKLTWIVLGLALVASCARVERLAIPPSEPLAPVWGRFAEAPGPAPNHDDWDSFLARYHSVDQAGIARIDYAAVTDADRALLGRYIEGLEATDLTTLDRAQALAFWINAYNAATVAVVLDAYPVGSIREITDGPLSIGPWDRKVMKVEGVPLSLNDIEHKIIRPFFDEHRIHYAVNCAAAGCPNLEPTAWRAEGLTERLARAERAYVNDPRGVTIGPDGQITVSKIYLWFEEDFGDGDAAVLESIARAAEPELAAALAGRDGPDGYDYDWSLNSPR